jgi:chemotaxis protein methyltransferase CheR
MVTRSQNLSLPEGTGVLIQSLINERTGMFFDNGKSDLLLDKLSPLVIERGFTSYLDYYYLLKYDTNARAEWQNVMNALSVQETYFWREIDRCERSCKHWRRSGERETVTPGCGSGAPPAPQAKSR